MRIQKLVFLVLLLILGSCTPANPSLSQTFPPTLSTETVAPSQNPAPTAIPTTTPTLAPVITSTIPPSPTASPTFSPMAETVISAENGDQLALRSQWGRGSIQYKEQVSDSRILVLSSQGFYLFQMPELRWVAEYDGAVRFLTSPDKASAAILLPDRSVQLIDLKDGSVRHTYLPQGDLPSYLYEGLDEAFVQSITQNAGPDSGMAFSHDSHFFAYGDINGTITVWDNETGTIKAQLYHDVAGFTQQIEFTPDNRSLISIGRPVFSFSPSSRLSFWSLDEQELSWFQSLDGRLDPALLSPDSSIFGIYFRPAGARRDLIRLFSSIDGKQIAQISGTASENPYTPDSSLFVSTNMKNIQIEKLQPDTVHLRTLYTNLDNPTASFSPDGAQLVVNQVEQIYSVPEFSLLSEGPPAAAPVVLEQAGEIEHWLALGFGDYPRGLSFSPEGDVVVWGGINPVWRWDPLTAQVKWITFTGDPTTEPAISSDGSLIAACIAEQIEVYDFGGQKRTVAGTCKPRSVLAFAPGGNILANGYKNKITTYDISTGERLQDYLGEGYPVGWIDFSPSGRYFASGGYKCGSGGCVGDLHLWQVSPAQGIRITSEESQRPVYDVAFTSDEERMIVTKGYTWLWETGNGNLDGKIPVMGDVLAVSPDNKILVVNADDGSIRIISLETRQVIKEISAHKDHIIAMAFTPDGANLLSLGNSGNLKLWAVP